MNKEAESLMRSWLQIWYAKIDGRNPRSLIESHSRLLRNDRPFDENVEMIWDRVARETKKRIVENIRRIEKALELELCDVA